MFYALSLDRQCNLANSDESFETFDDTVFQAPRDRDRAGGVRATV
jgi:hypothetical protein